MFEQCPGASNIRTPTIELKTCPQCSTEIEMFSSDMQMDCPKCGFTVYNDLESCIKWCKYAKEFVGEEVYEMLMKNVSKQE